MANTKSAKKRAAKSAAQREKNRANRSTMRTVIKKVRAAAAEQGEDAEALLAQAISLVDRTAKKGVIHKNTAARTKSRLTAAVRKSKQQ